MRSTCVAIVALLLAAPASAQTPFTTHLEGLRVLYETEVARANAAVTEAAAATAALTVSQQQIAALQASVTALQAQVVTLNAEIQRLNDLLNQQPPPPPPPAADEFLWPATTTPAVVDFADPGSYEIGVKFRSSVAGNVKGVRFYKAAANTGTHVGHLWLAAGGAALATVTFTDETTSGWQQMLFSAPVAIQANTLYIASVHMPSGHYSANTQYFQVARTSGPLTAVASSESQNGCFKSGAAGFPATGSSSSANYWVDVVFSAGTVTPPPPGTQIRVEWDAPTTNTDGTPCTDLAGYRVAWGSSAGSYGAAVDTQEQTFMLPVLPAGQHYVVVRAYDTSSNESILTAPLAIISP